MATRLTSVTRRDILDACTADSVSFYGRLEEMEFLSRIWNLQELPSTDSRFRDAAGDIWQHTVNNDDWAPGWVFSDSRFDLLNGDDETFLRFLCESLHPVVRSDVVESERLRQLYNQYLRNDGYEIAEKTQISGKPVYAARYVGSAVTPGVRAARNALGGADPGYVSQQITRMEAAVNHDPELAIGTAKELVEGCCKDILHQRNAAFSNADDLPKLVRATVKQLKLTPDDIPDQFKASETIKRLLSNLATITQGVAELRNHYGTGHGRLSERRGLQPRHARLAVGAASTLSVFLTETHRDSHEG